MSNTLTSADLKRRGLAAIEESLQNGPVHLLKRNKRTAVVLTEDEYQRLLGKQSLPYPGMTALQWLLNEPGVETRSREEIDAALASERDW